MRAARPRAIPEATAEGSGVSTYISSMVDPNALPMRVIVSEVGLGEMLKVYLSEYHAPGKSGFLQTSVVTGVPGDANGETLTVGACVMSLQ